jgi:hypothetical protein
VAQIGQHVAGGFGPALGQGLQRCIELLSSVPDLEAQGFRVRAIDLVDASTLADVAAPGVFYEHVARVERVDHPEVGFALFQRRRLAVRVDAGGGFGGSVTDLLNHDADLGDWFEDFEVQEVHFNAAPQDEESYDDLVTEMYADAGESLLGLAIEDAPEQLEADLTERTYRWVNRRGRAVKKLTDKEQFRRERGRSPDDGDGFVLAVASDFLFDSGVSIAGLGSLYGRR